MLAQKFSVEKILFDHQILSEQTITVRDDKIASIEKGVDRSIPYFSGVLVPGFIDIQVNGGGGYLFNQSPDLACLAKIGQAHQKFGTTGWLPTLVTDSFEKMLLAADTVAKAISSGLAGVIGIHFEGPHLSLDKKGVHSAKLIRQITRKEIDLFLRKDIGKVVVTLAPESVAIETIKILADAGVLVCLGHSNASFEQANKALAAGAKGFTHLFNAMSQFESRAPGMVGAALLGSHSYSGLILDGIHVHPDSARLAFNMNKNIMLVTDAMPPVGSDELSFDFFGQTITRSENTLRDSQGRLAGSVLDMATAVKNAQIMLGLSLAEAIQLAAYNPAKFLAIDEFYGCLAVGKKASMLLLDEHGTVVNSWIDGNQIF